MGATRWLRLAAVAAVPMVAASAEAQRIDSLMPPPASRTETPPAPADGKNDLATAKRAVAVEPQAADNWALLGWRLYTDSRYPEAEYALAQARRLAPRDAYVQWLSGLTAYMLGDYLAARTYLMQVYTEHRFLPASIQMETTFDVLGRTHLLDRNGDLFAAAVYFAKAAEHAPRKWEHHFLHGVINWYRGMPGHALESLERAKQLNDDEPTVLRYYAWAKAATFANHARDADSSSELKAALKAANDAIKAEPDRYESYETLARLYAAVGRYDEASVQARRAMALGPNEASPRYFLAKVLLERDSTSAEAEDLLVQSIAMAPWYFEGRNEAVHVQLLASLYMRSGRHAKAKALLEWQSNLPPRP